MNIELVISRNNEASELILASIKDAPQLAETLALAFNSDPIFLWMMREDSRRLWALKQFFSFILTSVFSEGEVYSTKGLEACALWFPPGKGFIDSSPETIQALQPEIMKWTKKDKVDRLFQRARALIFKA